MAPTILLIEAAVLGLVIGSFLNVCIYRIPLGLSLGGRSFCPICKEKISWFENIPIFSFIFLKRRCRHCHRKISFQYPLVELVTAGLSVLTLLHNAFDPTGYLIWFFLFISPLLVISIIDIHHRIIPDIISLPGIPIGFLVVLFLSWPNWTDALLFSLSGALCGGGALFILGQLYLLIRKREGMGGGDVKLAAMLGAFLGWKGMIFIFLISSILAIIYAIISMLFQQKEQEGPMIISYGPFLALAALIFYFYGQQLAQFYFSLVGLPALQLTPWPL